MLHDDRKTSEGSTASNDLEKQDVSVEEETREDVSAYTAVDPEADKRCVRAVVCDTLFAHVAQARAAH